MALATRDDLGQRLMDLGHQYLGTVRAGEMIEEAAKRITLEELWPWRRKTATLDAGGLIAGLGISGPVCQVLDTSRTPPAVLVPKRIDALRDGNVDLSASGTARYYYVGYTAAGLRKVVTAPLVTSGIQVDYWGTESWATGGVVAASGADTPLWPLTHRELIINAARVLAYEDSDDYEAAAQQEAKYQRRLDDCRDELLTDQWDEFEDVRITQELV